MSNLNVHKLEIKVLKCIVITLHYSESIFPNQNGPKEERDLNSSHIGIMRHAEPAACERHGYDTSHLFFPRQTVSGVDGAFREQVPVALTTSSSGVWAVATTG